GITIYFQFKGIYMLSKSPIISIFILITLGFYTFSFNAARQGIALAIFIYSMQFIINNKFKYFILFIGLGFFFHKSIIVALPLYFLFRLEFNIRLIILLLFSTIVSIFYFDDMLNIGLLISDKYSIYTILEASGGQMLTIAYTIFGIFFIFMKSFLKDKDLEEYDIYLNLYSIGTIIYFIVQFTGAYIEITRLAIYFLSSAIFIWPIIFKRISYDLKPLVFIFFATSHLLFYYTLINKIGNLNPYIINAAIFK
ncbi:MAG: EpsG family protein, partial [Pelagibacterales bacterium]|nr:EpsG family protein [Pelagibacterales bacterium]